MTAEIITIGDEILIGQIVDTNSAWIAGKLNDVGIRVRQMSSVSDEQHDIIQALGLAAARADIIIMTGGLGPTKDDLTKKTLAQYFGVGFRRDTEALENVKTIFSRYKAPLLQVNEQQADVPENCVVLQNKNGTAPGMWFEHLGKIYISMPGVPFEMKYMLEEEVIPKLKQYFKLPAIVHHTMLTAGIGESFLAQAIAEVEDVLPPHIRLAYLPNLGQVRLRLSAYGGDPQLLKEEVADYSSRIKVLIPDYIISEEDKPLEKVILDIMKSNGLTLSVAESCTGGFISHLITRHPGSSSVFLGGAITYSNQLKESLVGVSGLTLVQYGAVSEEAVREMAEGAIDHFKSDYSIAVSGIAGPDGGTAVKPVGTVWIAVASKNKTLTRCFQFGNKRLQNIERSAINAFTTLFKLLKEELP